MTTIHHIKQNRQNGTLSYANYAKFLKIVEAVLTERMDIQLKYIYTAFSKGDYIVKLYELCFFLSKVLLLYSALFLVEGM